MLESFATPGVGKREDVDEILDDFGVGGGGRGGVGAGGGARAEEVVARCLPPAVPGKTWRVVAARVEGNDVSSTAVRDAVARGDWDLVGGMVANEGVREYVRHQGLYR